MLHYYIAVTVVDHSAGPEMLSTQNIFTQVIQTFVCVFMV